jgi:MFS family permease
VTDPAKEIHDVPATPVPLGRNRDFLVLWTGQMVSTLGTRISATAIPLLVLAMTGSPADAGIVGAAGTVPYLMSLPVGVLVDRWNRRTIMLVSQVAAGIALFSIPVALWLHHLSVGQLALAAFVQGCGGAFYGVAESAALPVIVPPVQRPAAVAQNEARSRGAFLVGPPLGGVLYGLGRAVPFLVDALSYLVAVVGLLFIRGPLQGERSHTDLPLRRQMIDGLRWLWRLAFARTAVLLIAASNLVFAALALVLIVLARTRGATSSEIGLMMGIYGGGGLLGTLVAARLHRHLNPKVVLIGINWIWAALLPMLLLTPNPLLLGAIAGATAFVGPLWDVAIMTYQMAIVPEQMMGRVASTVMMVTAGVMPLGSLGAGYLLDTLGPSHTLLVLTAVMVAVAIAASLSRAIRHIPPLADTEALAALAPTLV